MAERQETNVRIPDCAMDALHAVSSQWTTSRDATLRALIERYVDAQGQLEPDDRLTHIATVLRYPRPPRFRNQPKPGRALRLRAEPKLIERAKEVALRLPGQYDRAHRDYPARRLTDAVLTSIAMMEQFEDEFLHGLMPLLRQGSALSLWHLAVAATASKPERVVRAAARQIRADGPIEATPDTARRKKLLLVDEALDKVSWHDDTRFTVAANIARRNLTGPGADRFEETLYQQDRAWEQERDRLTATTRLPVKDADDLDGLADGLPGWHSTTDGGWLWQDVANWYDVSGRGAAAVWRAQRRVELDDLAERLGDPAGGEWIVDPPGWALRCKEGTHARRLPVSAEDGLPEPFASWHARCHVTTLAAAGRQWVWPLERVEGAHGCPRPALDLQPIVAAARRVAPTHRLELVESVMVDWGGHDDEAEAWFSLDLPADGAYRHGFIDADERRRLMAVACEATMIAMRQLVSELPKERHAVRDHLSGPAEQGRTTEFQRIARRAGLGFTPVKARWRWPHGPILEQARVVPRDASEWLATWAYKACHQMLSVETRKAWEAGFDHLGDGYWTRL